jgi:ligand-binding sensor domain-containing protein
MDLSRRSKASLVLVFALFACAKKSFKHRAASEPPSTPSFSFYASGSEGLFKIRLGDKAPLVENIATLDVRAFDVKDNLWAVGTPIGLYISKDLGKSWTSRDAQNSSLMSNDVRDVLIDSRGWIFVATSGGLALSKDQGANFRVYTRDQGLPSNDIYSLHQDAGGFIYVGTTQGLAVAAADLSSFQVFAVHQSQALAAASLVMSIESKGVFGSPGNEIIVGTNGHAFAVSTDGGANFNFMRAPCSSLYVKAIKIGPDGKLYVGGSSPNSFEACLGVYDQYADPLTVSSQVLTTQQGLPGGNVSGIDFSGGKIFVSTNRGVGLATLGAQASDLSFQQFGSGALDPSLSTSDLKITANAQVFVGTERGLLVSDTSASLALFKSPAGGLLSNSIFDVFTAPDSSLYVATPYGISISKNGGASFTSFKPVTDLPHDPVHKVDADGSNIYISTTDKMYRSPDKGATWIKIPVEAGLEDSRVKDMVVDAKHRLYVGTPTGVFVSSDFGKSFTAALRGVEVNGLALGQDGLFYVGAVEGVYQAKQGSFDFRKILDTSYWTAAQALSQDPSLGLLYGTPDGLFNMSTHKSLAVTDSTTRRVYDVLSSNNWVVVAGSGGLFYSSDRGASFRPIGVPTLVLNLAAFGK